MLSAIFRVLFGFAFACLAAGATQVLFAVPPGELQSASNEQLLRVGEWMLLTATQSAVFAAPFAMIAAALGEWQGIRSLSYYLMSGLVIAVAAFLALFSGEGSNDPTILNSYALMAYLTTGVVAGLAYWLFGGRFVPVEAPSFVDIDEAQAADKTAAERRREERAVKAASAAADGGGQQPAAAAGGSRAAVSEPEAGAVSTGSVPKVKPTQRIG